MSIQEMHETARRQAIANLLGTLFEKLLDSQGLWVARDQPNHDTALEWFSHGSIPADDVLVWLTDQVKDFGITAEEMGLCTTQALGLGLEPPRCMGCDAPLCDDGSCPHWSECRCKPS